MPVFSGQGRLLIGPRETSGAPGPLRWVGEIDPKGISVDFKVDTFDVKESSSGFRGTLDRIVQGKEATLKFGFQEFNADNLALQVLGTKAEVSAGTVTGEVLPATLAAQDIVALAHPKVTSVVVKDSASTPATLVAGTNYSIESADYGTLRIIDVATFTQPLTADYSYGAVTQVPMMAAALSEVTVRAELLNTADAMKKLIVEIYRVRFDAAKTLELIQEKDIAMGAMEGAVLLDPTKPAEGPLGQFGRVLFL